MTPIAQPPKGLYLPKHKDPRDLILPPGVKRKERVNDPRFDDFMATLEVARAKIRCPACRGNRYLPLRVVRLGWMYGACSVCRGRGAV
ncbi:MAG: hypothetical protein JXA57_17800 [Armatimonadetes bacterium]|nr:hypothetical protein [Armatimonadota bacterium]